MDYTKAKLGFKVRKLFRYILLYGFSRTLVKVKGQYHMQAKVVEMKSNLSNGKEHKNVGLIGCGNYAYSNIAYYLKKNYGNVINSCMDIDINRANSLANSFKIDRSLEHSQQICDDDGIDIVYVASNHSTHAEYAIEALNKNKIVHIEKPHVVSHDQNERLYEAYEASSGFINLGFNRPNSKFGRIIRRALEKDTGPMMITWFIAGHKIDPDHWYFKKEEGGRVLGNLCHWTDFTLKMIDPSHRYPLTIIPVKYKKADSDIIANYIFGDGSIASITFSAKGHTFEGVREKLMVHRGNTLVWMDDFRNLTVECLDNKRKYRNLYRDQGHEENILRSYNIIENPMENSCSPKEVYETAHLFLKTKDALDSNETIVIHGDELK